MPNSNDMALNCHGRQQISVVSFLKIIKDVSRTSFLLYSNIKFSLFTGLCPSYKNMFLVSPILRSNRYYIPLFHPQCSSGYCPNVLPSLHQTPQKIELHMLSHFLILPVYFNLHPSHFSVLTSFSLWAELTQLTTPSLGNLFLKEFILNWYHFFPTCLIEFTSEVIWASKLVFSNCCQKILNHEFNFLSISIKLCRLSFSSCISFDS